MPGPIKIHVRGGYFRGGNSIEDVLELAKLGPAWFEMDFRLSNQGVLLSGHDETTYARLGGPLMSEIVNPLEVRNKRGGRCATLKAALEHMAPRSRMFIDLKNTWKPSKAEVAVETAIRDIETSKRTDEAVIMVYTRHAPLCTLRRTRIPFCLKQISRKYSEEENLEFVALASEFGAKYICCPVPPSYGRFVPACREAGVIPVVVPTGEKHNKAPEIFQHLENGVRHFICNLKMDLLNDAYSKLLEKHRELGRATPDPVTEP